MGAAKGSGKATGKGPRLRFIAWLRHRSLVTAEAVLLVGVLQQLLSQWLATQVMPNAARVALTMAMVLGLLGSIVVVVRVIAMKGVHHTHAVAKALPIPAATWLAHAAAFAALYLLYAIVWHLPVTVPVLGTVGHPAP